MITETEQGSNGTATEIDTKESLKTTNLMEKVFITGSMARCMKESGEQGLKKVKGSGEVSLVILTSENGKSRKPTATASTNGKTAIGMRASGRTV